MAVGAQMVSVIIPTHDRARLLARAMRSVLAQSYRDIELIVVDDASTDDTERLVANFDDPRVRYIRHDSKLGAAAARNTGIRAARGSFIAFQDSDDEWLLEKLEKQMRALAASGPEVDVAYCGFLRCNAGCATYVPGDSVKVRRGDVLAQLLRGNFISTQTLLVRRECIEDAGMFDERLPRFQDWELAIRLAARTRFCPVDEPLVIVHATPENISSDAAAGARALAIILEKHWGAISQHPSLLTRFRCHLGHHECLGGAMAEGRAQFRKALRLRPLALEAWAALCLALFGSRIYRLGSTARGRFR